MSASAVKTPDKIDRFEVQRPLGEGAFGAVFLAIDPVDGRRVAVKVPRLDRHQQQDTLNEVRSLRQLSHSGIVSILDAGQSGENFYIVSEYLDGPSLKQWMTRRHPSVRETIRIVIALADALAHAHAHRVVHRDLKPANIIMVGGRSPVIVDFDLAITEASISQQGRQKGFIAGTPAYMAPEQAIGEGHRIDGRTDLYALGVIFYELLTGQLPFGTDHASVLMKQIREDDPQPPRQLARDLPPVLENICLKAMAKDFFDRYTTADDLAVQLRAALRDLDKHPTEVATDSEIQTTVASTDSPTVRTPPGNRSCRATHRRVTAVQLSSDIFDSGGIDAAMNLSQQCQLLEDFQSLCRDVVSRYGGRPIQNTDQGVLACFGFPTAVDDATGQAVRMALDFQRELVHLNQRCFRLHNVRLAASVVIHTDEAVLRMNGNDEVSLAGRMRTHLQCLADQAAGGTIVLTEATDRLVRKSFSTKAIQPGRLKDGTFVTQYRVVAPRAGGRFEVASAGGRLTRLVGRESERSTLIDIWQRSSKGKGRVAVIHGEAGIGKSRLLHELKQHVGRQDTPAIIIDWQADQQRQASSLQPAIDAFEQQLGLNSDVAPIKRLSRLVRYLDDLDIEGDQEVALMASLLSIPLAGCYPSLESSPEQQKEQTTQLLLRWLSHCCRRQPVLLCVEDLHWIDPSSLELIDRLVRQHLPDRLMVVATHRPEFDAGWLRDRDVIGIAPARLSSADIAEMVLACSPLKSISTETERLMAERTAGVPLFVEEFATNLGDDGSGIGDIPATLQDLLLARLDRVDSDLEVVQTAAAIGMDFRFDLAAEIIELPRPELERQLDRLLQLDLLYRFGHGPSAQYTFKHALIRETAYQTMVETDRVSTHRRIATVIEDRFHELCTRSPEIPAFHFTQSRCWDRSVDYWQRSAERSTERAANEEAKRHLLAALESLAQTEDNDARSQREVELRGLLGVHLQSIHGYIADEVSANYDRASELCRKMNATDEAFPVLYGLLRYHMLQSNLFEATRLSTQLLDLASKTENVGRKVLAHRAMGCTQFYKGELASAGEHLQKVLHFEPTPELRSEIAKTVVVDPWVTSRAYLSFTLWFSGETDLALVESDRSIAEGRKLKHPTALILPVGFSQWLHQLRGDVDRTEATCDLSDQLGEEYGFPFWNAWTLAIRGWVQDQRGDPDKAVQTIRDGIEKWQAAGSGAGSHYLYVLLAEAHLHRGDDCGSTKALDDAQRFADRTGERFYEAEIARTRGDVARQRGDQPAVIDEWYSKAMDIARRQGAKSLQQRVINRRNHFAGEADS